MTETATVALRCSPAIRALGVDPCGTAPSGTSFILVEHPLPWPHDVGEDERLAPILDAIVAARATGAAWRLQAIVPVQGRAPRVTAFVLPEGPVDRYRCFDAEVRGDPAAVASELIESGGRSGRPVERPTLLVCTHGRRDVCCGRDGTALWNALSEGRDHPDLVVDRTSHTGGHRFAPTAIVLPEGTCWGWLDPDLVTAVLARSGPVAAVTPHYRGSCAVASREEQIVERAVFERVGWSWLDHRRTCAVLERDGGRTIVRVESISPEGDRCAWHATTQQIGVSPVPECGRELAEAPKHEPVVELVAGPEVQPG